MTSSILLVRSATKKDIQSITKLAIQWENEGSTIGQITGDFNQYFDKTGYLFVAEEKNKIFGFLAAREYNTPLSVFNFKGSYIELEEFYISPEKQNQGVGSALLNSLKGSAKSKGISQFHLFSSSRRLNDVINFYNKHGFKVWSIQAYASE